VIKKSTPWAFNNSTNSLESGLSWLAFIGSGQVKSERLLPNGFDGGHALIGRFG